MPVRAASVCLVALLLLGASPAWADFRMEKYLPLGEGGTLTLETGAGSVTVFGDSPAGVVVRITADRDDLPRRMDFQFAAQPGAVRIRATRRSRLLDSLLGHWGFNQRVRFEVHVPRRTGVAVHTGGGSVDVTTLDGGARIRTSGGALRLQQIAGDVEARTSGGFIRVHEAGGRVDARTAGGQIQVRFAPGNGRGGALYTAGGSVEAAIDPEAALSIDASTAGGRVWSDLAVQTSEPPRRTALRGALNGGGPLLRLRTSGGTVRLSSRGH